MGCSIPFWHLPPEVAGQSAAVIDTTFVRSMNPVRKHSLATEATRESVTRRDSAVWGAQVGNLELSQAGVASPLSLLANRTAGLTR